MKDLRIKLLKSQRDKGLTGFTIAYLIGASRNPIGRVSGNIQGDYQEFVETLKGFQKLKDIPNCYVGISKCVTLKQPVAALYNATAKIREYGLEIIGSQNSTLYASPEYHKKGSFDSLVDELWKYTEQYVAAGEFSFENGQYSKFTDNEIVNIQRVKNA